MYFLDYQTKTISKHLYKKGIVIIEQVIKKNNVINLVKKKCLKFLNNPKYLMKSFNIKKALEKKKIINDVTIHQNNFFLKNSEFLQGYKKYSKFTNSVEIKDPLINFPELNSIIFSKQIIQICKNYFNTKQPYLLYVAFRCHFKNKLPESDVNFYHTDDRSFITKKSENLLKLAIPFHITKREKSEYSHLIIPKKKLGLSPKQFYQLQHSKENIFFKKKKRYIFQPKLKNRSVVLFDPNNHFHKANKPNKTRMICYVVFGKKTSYLSSKSKKIKIHKKVYNNFDIEEKKFSCLLRKVN